MWIKELTQDNKAEFYKWAKNMFHTVGSQSLPVQYVIKTFGYTEGYHFCNTWDGERRDAAFGTWRRLWQDDGCPDFIDQLHYSVDLVLDDVYNKVPDKYYEQYFEWTTSRHPDYLYRYASRSAQHLQFIQKKYPEAYQKCELLWPLDPSFHNHTKETLARQYWNAVTSDAYLPLKAIKNFITQVKGKTKEICDACTEADMKVLARNADRKEVQSIIKVVLHHRPDLRKTYFGDEMLVKASWSTLLYPCDEAYTFMQKHLKNLARYRCPIKTLLPFIRHNPIQIQSVLERCSLFGYADDVMRLTEVCMEKDIPFPSIYGGVEYRCEQIALREQWDQVIQLRNAFDAEMRGPLKVESYSNYSSYLKLIGSKRLKMFKEIYPVNHFVMMSAQEFNKVSKNIEEDSGVLTRFDKEPSYIMVVEQMKAINPKCIAEKKEEITLLF